MKKEVVLSLTSLIFMVLFMTGTTFLYFKKRTLFNKNFQTDITGIQMAFDDYSSYLSMNSSDTKYGKYNIKEVNTVKLYVRFDNIEMPQKINIFYKVNDSLVAFQNKDIYYEILNSHDNVLIKETKLDFLNDNLLYEETINNMNEDSIYTIRITVYDNNDETYSNSGIELIRRLSAQIL